MKRGFLKKKKVQKSVKEDDKDFHQLIDAVEQFSSSKKVCIMDGVFKRLLTPSTFRQVCFPTTEDSTFKELGLPRSFLQCIKSRHIRKELVLRMPTVRRKAKDIIEGMRRKALDQSNSWDKATEKVLKRDILREAFARQLVKVTKYVYRNEELAKNVVAEEENDERAGCRQFDDLFIRRLYCSECYAVQHNFFGSDWATAILSDCSRFSRDEKMYELTPRGEAGLQESLGLQKRKKKALPNRPKVSWVKLSVLEKYPALTEAIDALISLPFELNRRGNSIIGRKLKANLCETRAVLLSHYRVGDVQPRRLDAGTGENFNGKVITINYFLPQKEEEWKLSLSMDGVNKEVEIPLELDSLIAWRSREVMNAINCNVNSNSKKELYILTIWLSDNSKNKENIT
eukprot:g1277.t1